MKNRQLHYLFASNLIVLFTGMGLFPLLPLYATQFGATPTVIGIYFALMYVSNAAGTFLTTWATQWLKPRRAFIIVTALGVPALALLGVATALWQVVLLTGILWFSGGMALALANIFTAQHADDKRRGASFSLMFLGFPLGALLGGAVLGSLVEGSGFGTAFLVLTVIWAILPLIGLFALEEKEAGSRRPDGKSSAESTGRVPAMGGSFYLLLAVTLLSSLAINAGRLGTPLSMQMRDFSAGAIASTTTVSGLATIPVALMVGALSDRLGRERFLTVAYALAAGGVLVLVASTQIWHYWIAMTAITVALVSSGAVASALATDVLAPEALSRGLPWIKGMNSLAGIASFAGGGYVIENFGPLSLYVAGAVMAGAAAIAVHSMLKDCPETAPVTGSLRFCMNPYGQVQAET